MKALLIFLALSLNLSAQDPIFTNTQQSLIHLNPSFAGSNGGLRYQAIYRNQWYNLGSPYMTFYNSVDAYIKPMRGGIGLSYLHDDQANGVLKTDRIDLSYAQHLSFCNQKLKIIPSMQFSVFQKTVDNSKLNFGSSWIPQWGYGTLYSIKRNIDFSAGLIVNYNHFYIGGSVFHITQPQEGFIGVSKLPARLSLFTSYNFFIGDKVLLNAMYRYEQQNHFSQHSFSINALLFKHVIVEGGIAPHAAHATLGFRHNYFTVSGSYIFAVNTFSNTVGSYEVMASFNLRNKDDRKSVKDFERW
jgi:type IX secretion system PorP/SprF family membrane protein